MDFLDGNICKELRKVVNSSRIFHRDEQEKRNYNLICAVMDRVDDSVEFLNQYNTSSQNMNDIMLFMLHSCIIKDAVQETMEQLKIKDEQKEIKKHFMNVCADAPLYLIGDNCPTDIKFFEYLRALIFAHPLNTSRALFLKEKNEIHYSPFLLSDFNNLKKDCIGILVYSNQQSETKTLYVPYDSLKSFIKNRYEQLILVKNELERRIENKNEEWKRKKINRNQPDIQILQEVYNTLNDRFCDTYEIEFFIKILKYQSDNQKNSNAVQKLKDLIVLLIPQICDSVDNLDYDELANIVDEIIYAHPKNTYQMFRYDREKIFSYLDENTKADTDKTWGLQRAKQFSEQFAKKWVDIEAETMSYDEIKLLTITACYLELQAEKGNMNE